jgi:glucose/arabinose dehydrogenase
LNGYQVIFVPFVRGTPSGKPIPVVTGFLSADNRTVRGRPVGVALDRTGALIIADDAGNAVWRVSAATR